MPVKVLLMFLCLKQWSSNEASSLCCWDRLALDDVWNTEEQEEEDWEEEEEEEGLAANLTFFLCKDLLQEHQ